jgi:hypothetical protein
MNNGPWHLDDDLLDTYAQGLPMASALTASVEAHLERCLHCQTHVAPSAEPTRLDAVWAEVVDAVDAPRVGAVERLVTRLGVPADTARLLGVTPSLQLSWLTGTAIVLALALSVAHSGERGVAVFLALAPVLPVAGVAVAFSARTDPLHEVAAAAPYSSYRLLLVRSAAVVATTLLLAVPAAALLPSAGWVAAAWLLPALALTSTCLALGARIDPIVSSAGLGTVWLALALSGLAARRDPLVVASLASQLGCLVLLVLACAALVHQRRALLVSGSPA